MSITLEPFSFDDLTYIDRDQLGDFVPLELYRAIRLIGMYQGLPMKGKATTVAVGKKIGESLPIESIDEALIAFQNLNIGIPSILKEKEEEFHIKVEDCFCKGIPHKEGHLVCDLEGAILAGAIAKVVNKKVTSKEIKCNVNGDSYCEYKVTIQKDG